MSIDNNEYQRAIDKFNQSDYRKTSVYLNAQTMKFLQKYPQRSRSGILNRIVARYESILGSTKKIKFTDEELRIIKNALPKRIEPNNLYLFLKDYLDGYTNLLAKINQLDKNQEISLLDQLDNFKN